MQKVRVLEATLKACELVFWAVRLGVWGQSLGRGQPPKASDTTCTAEAPFQEEAGMGTSCFTRWPQDALADDPLHSPRSPVKPIFIFSGCGRSLPN